MLLPETAEQQLGPITAKSVLPDADAEILPPKGGEPEGGCCSFDRKAKFVYADNAQVLVFGYSLTTAASGAAFRAIQKVYVNGTLYDDASLTLALSGPCAGDSGGGTINYESLGECPDYVRIEVDLQFATSAGTWITCGSQEYMFTDAHVYNLTNEPPCATPSDPDVGFGFN